MSALLISGSGVKPGTVEAFAGAVPAGWLECNGAAISRTAYAKLFLAIGTAYGAGDGATTFNLPDTRGEFIRGLDAGRGVDAGRAIGSDQLGTAITESITFAHRVVVSDADPETSESISHYQISNSATRLAERYRVRPRNVAMRYGIKF